MKTLFLAFVMPPGGMITLTVIGLLLLRRKPVLGRRLIWSAVVLLLLQGMPVVSDLLMLGLERNLPTQPSASAPPRAIVVLGAEVARMDGETPSARVGPLTLERLRTAAELQRKTGLPVLVTGGVTQPDGVAVGMLMACSLTDDFLVPVRWSELKSRDTWENATFSRDILRGEGIDSVYIVTHGWHMRRALVAFAPTGLTVTAAPTPLGKLSFPILSDFIPRITAWENTYFALHEWIGCVWYALR